MKKTLICCLLIIAASILAAGQVVTIQPQTDTVPLRIGPGVVIPPPTSDLLDIFCNTGLTPPPCFSVSATGTFTFSGNTAIYGTQYQLTPSWIQLWGGGGPDAYLEETSAGLNPPTLPATLQTFTTTNTGAGNAVMKPNWYLTGCISYTGTISASPTETQCESTLETKQNLAGGNAWIVLNVPAAPAFGTGFTSPGWNYYAATCASAGGCPGPLQKQNSSPFTTFTSGTVNVNETAGAGSGTLNNYASLPTTNTANYNYAGYWFISPITGVPCFSASPPTGDCNTTNSNYVAMVPGTTAITNTHCADWSVVTGVTTLNDNGGPCPITLTSSSHNWLASYTAATGLFTQTQPAVGDLQNIAANKVLGNSTGSTAAPAATTVTYSMTDASTIAPIASPTFTGTPIAPTPSTSDNSTKVATTAYVRNQAVTLFPAAVGTASNLTGQNASLGAQTLVSTPFTTGQYVVFVYMNTDSTCTNVGPGQVVFTLAYGDAVGGVTKGLTATYTSSNHASALQAITFWAVTGTAITYTTTLTQCTAPSSGSTYDVHAYTMRIQ